MRVLNLPLIADTLAVRAVIFSDHRGGYIDNVPGTIELPAGHHASSTIWPATRPPTTRSSWQQHQPGDLHRRPAVRAVEVQRQLESPAAAELPEHGGGRLLLRRIRMAPDGAALQPYQITAFTPAYDKDSYESTAWTLNGKIGAWLLKAGLHRQLHGPPHRQQQDYSNYLRSAVGSYYACIGTGAGYFNRYFRSSQGRRTCYAPVGTWNDTVDNTHQSHEFRFSTIGRQSHPRPGRRLLGEVRHRRPDELQLPGASRSAMPANLAISARRRAGLPVGGRTGSRASTRRSGLRVNSNTAFGEDVQRGYKQTRSSPPSTSTSSRRSSRSPAARATTTTTSSRRARSSTARPSSSLNVAQRRPVDLHGRRRLCGFRINLNKSESGYKQPRQPDLAHHAGHDGVLHLLARLPSGRLQPYRISCRRQRHRAQRPMAPYYARRDGHQAVSTSPSGYNSDNLINNEIGFKSELFDHRLLVNVSAVPMKWENVQLSLFDPVHLGNTTFDVNGPTYVIKGVELQFVARVTEGLPCRDRARGTARARRTHPA